MKTLQKTAGLAALYEAAAYLIGIVFYIFVVDYSGSTTPDEQVLNLINHQLGLYIITLLVYVFFGVCLVVLVLALYDRLKTDSPAMMQAATVFGFIWACVVIASGMIFNIGAGVVIGLYNSDPVLAATAWVAIDAVFEGIGGGTEILGGIWVLLISWSALTSGKLHKFLNYLGILIAAAGILSIIPAFGEACAAIFGLGQIIWFIWLGFILYRNKLDK